ncbi:cache domain-containing protein, partial [Falsiroseomonas oryzae]|uniref:cache domain-containing protein n=1 Tax=Falsiroseomonas oryzae TaxID=2766473 RepID=UPI0022EA976C
MSFASRHRLPLHRRLRSALHGMRLPTRLLLLIGTCLLPLVVLQLGSTWAQWSDRKARLGSLATQQAHLLAGNVETIAEGARILLGAAAEFRQVRIRGEGCSNRLIRLREHAQGFAFIALVEPDGSMRCASEAALLRADPAEPWLRAAQDAQGFSAGRFARSASLPGPFLPFYGTVGALDGEPGTLVAGLDLAWLGEHLQRIKHEGLPFMQGGVLTVADADGVVLGRDVRHAEFVGQRFPPAALPMLTATEAGMLRLRSMDGTDRLVGYTPPTPANLYLATAVGFNEAEMLGDPQRALVRGAALLLAVALLATLLTLLVARRFITAPTQALLAAARRWREGDLGV